jgi:hypothetical protein
MTKGHRTNRRWTSLLARLTNRLCTKSRESESVGVLELLLADVCFTFSSGNFKAFLPLRYRSLPHGLIKGQLRCPPNVSVNSDLNRRGAGLSAVGDLAKIANGSSNELSRADIYGLYD